jgi:hypothetical protein
MCGVELQVIFPLAPARFPALTSCAQLLCGSSPNDLVSFGLTRRGAEELAAAVDGIADMEKWMELQVCFFNSKR